MPGTGLVGRPSKFTPEACESILLGIRGGNYLNVACELAGVSYRTFRRWMVIAEDPDGDPAYAEFAEKVAQAEAQAEAANIAVIRQAARPTKNRQGDWKAAAWLEERRHPQRWGRRDTTAVEVSGPDGGPIAIDATVKADVESIASLAGILARRDQAQSEKERKKERYDAQRAAAPESGDPEVIDVEIVEPQAAADG